MQIVYDYPRNFPAIQRTFPTDLSYAIFAWGDILYNPSRAELPEQLLVHEGVHQKQQEGYHGGPEAWWERYLIDVPFRLDQELKAYRAQYVYMKKTEKNWNRATQYIDIMAKDLSSPIYGSMISYEAARRAIIK